MILSYLMASNLCSFSLTGFFTLKSHECRRTTTVRRDGSTSTAFHLFYDTDLSCGKLKSMPATVRIYSPPGDAPLTNDTVAYVNTQNAMSLPRSTSAQSSLMHLNSLPSLATRRMRTTRRAFQTSSPPLSWDSVLSTVQCKGPQTGLSCSTCE